MGKDGKKPRQQAQPAGERTIRTGGNPEDYNKQTPVWRVDIFDANGPWGSQGVVHEVIWSDILPKLKNYETMTWNQILQDKKRNHSVSAEDLIKPARDRILQLKLDVDELFRLRLSGTQRLWGIRDRNTLRILWWDPDHIVCPSVLKNT